MGGTEIDFVAGRNSEKVLIESKMNHQLKGRETMISTLRANLRQLDAHVRAAQSQGISISCAVCVVNHPRNLLAQLQRAISPLPNSPVPAQLLSYEDLNRWMNRVLTGRKYIASSESPDLGNSGRNS
jgi:hypothetical protein